MTAPRAIADPQQTLVEEGVGWKRNLLFIWIGVFVGLVGANFVFPFMPFYIKNLGVTDTSSISYYSGLSEGATGLSLTLTAPLWGAIADRFGRRPMFLRALVGAGVLIGLMGIVQAVWQLILLRFLMGAFAGTMGAAAALVAASTPREKVGRALGTLQTAAFSANMLGPVLGGLVASSLGIRESFIFCAVLYAAAALLVYVFVREPKSTLAPMAAVPGAKASAKGGIISDLRTIASDHQIMAMLILMFMLWLGTTFVRPVMPLNIDDFSSAVVTGNAKVTLSLPWRSYALNAEAATGIVFGLIGLTPTIAALTVSPLGDRFGYRRCVAAAALLSGLLYVPVALAGSFNAFLLMMGAVGLFQGAMVPGLNALIAVSVPDGKQGSAFGLAASMQSLALLVGPVAGGVTAGLLGIHSPYIVIGFVLVLTGIGAYVFIREPDAFVPQRTKPLVDH
jgi:DHA1 family multidrug resistance protein-like MFS transporter